MFFNFHDFFTEYPNLKPLFLVLKVTFILFLIWEFIENTCRLPSSPDNEDERKE